MMNTTAILIKTLQFILSISFLVVLHELGHFIPAKIFKTKVEKFFLFFDVKFALFKKKIGETIYGIGWLPLGGYVKIAGMIDESMDTEQMSMPAQPWEFRSKPAWQRLIIMIGGVTVNLILGFFIYMMILWVWGETQVRQQDIPQGYSVSSLMASYGFKEGDIPVAINGEPLENTMQINKYLLLRKVRQVTVHRQDGTTREISLPENIGQEIFEKGEMLSFVPLQTNEIEFVKPGSPAEKAGIQAGDKILTINGRKVSLFEFMKERIQSSDNKEITLGIKDVNGTLKEVIVTPKDNKIGVLFKSTTYQKHTKTYDVLSALTHGFSYGYWTLRDYVSQFKFVFTKKGASQMGGFASMANMFGSSWNWEVFWHTTALLSIIFAVMNILPIPALDGGHVMFLLYEMITGKTPHQKVLEYAQMAGFFILIALLLYANGNDIYRIFFK